MLHKLILEKCGKRIELMRERFRRYEIKGCFLLIETEHSCEILIDFIRENIRKLDEVEQLDERRVCVIFNYVDEANGGMKAAENLFTRMQALSEKTGGVWGGLSCLGSEHTNLVSNALYALDNARKHESYWIEDDYALRKDIYT